MVMSNPEKDYEEFKREKAEIALKVWRLTVGGLAITALLLGGSICYMIAQWETMKTMEPNEWGDFLAGWLGPIGVLWLIVGYLQQGLELRQNTRALETQAKELRDQVKQLESSVTQQTALVLATQEQIGLERERQKREEELRFQQAQPRFVFEGSWIEYRPDRKTCVLSLDLTNIGSTISNVVIRSEPRIDFRPNRLPQWSSSETDSFRWDSSVEDVNHAADVNSSIDLIFIFLDGMGNWQSQAFEVFYQWRENPKEIVLDLIPKSGS